MKRYTNSKEEVMANGMTQSFRTCKNCGMMIPDNSQILIDHAQKCEVGTRAIESKEVRKTQ